jgi:sortase A
LQTRGGRLPPTDRLIARLAGRGAQRALTAAAGVLIVLAVVLLAFPVFTDVRHNHLQTTLSKKLDTTATRTAYLSGTIRPGQGLTRLRIPRIGVDVVVVQGTSPADLEAGAGHYLQTPLPCTTGDVAIAGHRTTYGKPFANINLLTPGDLVTLTTPIGSCVYRVAAAPFVVPADDVAVVDNTPGRATLTLTACHPKGSATHRIVVKATLVTSEQTT